MKRIIILLLALSAISIGCHESENANTIPNIIFDTDIGNDIDDAEALDLLYKYQDEGKINLLGICLNKTGIYTAKFIDLMATWYGYPDIPVGIINTDQNTGAKDEWCYTGAVCSLTREDGTPLFETSGRDYESLPTSVSLYRKLLSEADDHSVTVASVGFLTNLSLLLDTEGDEYSPLSGPELVKKKVRLLSIMAGRFFDEVPEFNITRDIPAARRIFSEWPTEMAVLTWELGDKVHYPASSIENDFNWTEAHPLKEAYIRYLPMPYDNAMFDPTAIVYAAGDTQMFTIGEPGGVTIDETGVTRFQPSEEGPVRIIYLSDEQAATILEYFRDYLTRHPKARTEK